MQFLESLSVYITGNAHPKRSVTSPKHHCLTFLRYSTVKSTLYLHSRPQSSSVPLYSAHTSAILTTGIVYIRYTEELLILPYYSKKENTSVKKWGICSVALFEKMNRPHFDRNKRYISTLTMTGTIASLNVYGFIVLVNTTHWTLTFSFLFLFLF